MTTAHDKLKAKLAGAKAGFGWKPKDGDNRVMILPPGSEFVGNLDGVESLAFQHKAHWFKMEGRQWEATRCLEDLGQRCPACAAYRANTGSTDPGLKEMAKGVRQSDAYIFNIIDLNDTAKGVQRWSANWTCWTDIMEIACNPAWGYVYDPTSGIAFVVTFTKKDPRRGGNNSYKVAPEPQRISVTEVLVAAGGITALDGLEDAAMEAKSPDEIISLLKEMGFPELPAPGSAPRAAAPRAVGVATPVPVAASAQPVPVAAAPAAVPVAAAPVAAAPVAVAAAPAAQPVAVAGGVHYDPGPSYTPVTPDAERPVGAPRCFGDYKPSVHKCEPCPLRSPCQVKMLGIAG